MSAPTTSLSGFSFLLAEDEALQKFVSGIKVRDGRSAAREVPVWYRYPEGPFNDVVFPFITLEYQGLVFDRERAHTHQYNDRTQGYLIDQQADDGTTQYRVLYPIPMLVEYTVATHCREPRHDRALTGLFTTTHFNERFATLVCPLDQTLRRIEVRSGGMQADYMDPNAKRVLQKVWNIAIETEIPVDTPVDAATLQTVTDVVLTVETIT